MPRRNRRQLCGVRQIIAAPDDVQIGAQQQEVVAIDLARTCIGNIEDSERRAIARKSPCQQRTIGRGAGKAKERVAVTNPVVQRHTVGKPDVRQLFCAVCAAPFA